MAQNAYVGGIDAIGMRFTTCGLKVYFESAEKLVEIMSQCDRVARAVDISAFN